MSQRLSGKYCLITGAGAGIGRETALAFAREGATVLATDIDAAALDSLAANSDAIRTQLLDVTDAMAIDIVATANPAIDVLFNCAGYVHAGSLLETDFSAWRRSFAINVDSMFHLCRAVLPSMLARGRGNIVNMASVASSIKGVANRCAYGASKAAVRQLTQSVAQYCAEQRLNVRCNSVRKFSTWRTIQTSPCLRDKSPSPTHKAQSRRQRDASHQL